jgi:dTDP-4-dehydrorhamnose reductase
MSKVKVLVLGSTGMVGHVLAARFREFPLTFEVVTTARIKIQGFAEIALEASDFGALANFLDAVKPDVCINAIGILNRAADELEISEKLNTKLPLFLSEMGIEMGFQLIHISTDCVFSGRRGGYIEINVPDAADNYGLTKNGGEGIDPKHLVIRTSLIGPEIRPQAIGLFHWFTNQTGEVDGYQNVIWSGVTTLVLADAIIDAIKNQYSGLVHLVNNETISKLALIQLMHQYFPNRRRQIVPTPIPVSNKSLISTRKDITFQVPSYEQMMAELRNWMELHPENYQVYLQRV